MLGLMLGAALLGACNSDDSYDASVPTNIELAGGDGQVGEVGTVLPDSLSVRILNLKGDPVANVTVQWFVLTVGGGTLSSATSQSGPTGLAQVAYTVGPTIGTQSIQAVSGSLSGSPVRFDITARAAGGGGGGGGALRLDVVKR
jgi:hypothetical protein